MTATGRPGSGAEAGFVAGFEALAFGVLVFVLGTLLMVNAWVVLDAVYAVNAASRVASQVVAAAPPDHGTDELGALARQAAARAVRAHGHDPDRLSVTLTPVAPLARCAEITVEVGLSVSVAAMPFGDGRSWHVASRAQALVDPLRQGLGAQEADCAFW